MVISKIFFHNFFSASLSILSYQMPILVPFFFILTSLASFIFKSTITITDPTCLRQFSVVFWAIYYKFFHWFFFSTYMTGMILSSSTISNGSVILLPSSLIHKCWYCNSKTFFSSYFFELHSLHDFASLTLLFLIKFWFVFKDLTHGTLLRYIYSYPWAQARVKFYGQNADRFVITYSPFISVCMGCLAHQLKINRKYNACFFEWTLNCTSYSHN